MEGEQRLIENMVGNSPSQVSKSVGESNIFGSLKFQPPWELLEIYEGGIGCQVLGTETLNIL